MHWLNFRGDILLLSTSKYVHFIEDLIRLDFDYRNGHFMKLDSQRKPKKNNIFSLSSFSEATNTFKYRKLYDLFIHYS